MNQEEILEKMKKTKNGEYERFTLLRGDNLAVCLSMLIAIILFIVKLVIKKEFDFGICAVLFTAVAVQTIHEGIKTEGSRLKKWFYIVAGSIVGVTAIMAIVLFLCGVIV